jgi:hypothetical protein
MSILVYINASNGLSKSAFEAVTYAKKLGEEVNVLSTGSSDSALLANLGLLNRFTKQRPIFKAIQSYLRMTLLPKQLPQDFLFE